MLAHRSSLSLKALKTTFTCLSDMKQTGACVSKHLQRDKYWTQMQYLPL